MISINYKGQTFGKLVVVERGPNSKNGHAKWVCECSCGNSTVVFASNLKSGHTTSCGCVNTEVITKHGGWDSPEYQSWKSMIQRCTNPKASSYPRYGGRGITICEAWLNSFKQFYEDMGPRPSLGHTLDRKNNDLGYYKENCRWANAIEQANNKTQRKAAKKD